MARRTPDPGTGPALPRSVVAAAVADATGLPRTKVAALASALAPPRPRTGTGARRPVHDAWAFACRLAVAAACGPTPTEAPAFVDALWALPGSSANAGRTGFGRRLEAVFAGLVADPEAPRRGTGAQNDATAAASPSFLDVTVGSVTERGLHRPAGARIAYGVRDRSRLVQDYRTAGPEEGMPAPPPVRLRRQDTIAIPVWEAIASALRAEAGHRRGA